MIIELRAADLVLGFKALGIYTKGLDAAKTACEKVAVDTMAIQTAASEAERASKWLGSVDEMEPGEARDIDCPSSVTIAMRTATFVYLTQLSKLAEKEIDMLVPVDQTKDLMSQLQSFADRLNGQMEMAGVLAETMDALEQAARAAEPIANDDTSATISINGGPAVPMDAFERRVDALRRDD